MISALGPLDSAQLNVFEKEEKSKMTVESNYQLPFTEFIITFQGSRIYESTSRVDTR